MCLALPAEILAIDGGAAAVDVDGAQMPVSLAFLDGVEAGDFVVVHVGYALSRIEPGEAALQLELMRSGRGQEVGP